MASKDEFKKANRILHMIKINEGKISLHDALDTQNISIWWWKAHKSWFMERFPYIRLETDSETESSIKFLVNTEII